MKLDLPGIVGAFWRLEVIRYAASLGAAIALAHVLRAAVRAVPGSDGNTVHFGGISLLAVASLVGLVLLRRNRPWGVILIIACTPLAVAAFIRVQFPSLGMVPLVGAILIMWAALRFTFRRRSLSLPSARATKGGGGREPHDEA